MFQTWNVRPVGHSDLGGFGDGMHVQVKDGYAFVGHMGEAGTSIVDVRDPSDPRVVARIPAAPNAHAHKVQIQGDVMLTNRELIPRHSPPHERGLAIHDVSDPSDRPDRLVAVRRAGRSPDDLVGGPVRLRDRGRRPGREAVPRHPRPERPVAAA